MLPKEFKKCKNCGASFKIYKTTDNCCSWECYNMLIEEKEKRKKKAKIKKVSDVRKIRLAIYNKKRDKYLKDFQTCEVDGCNNNSTNVHHKGGRVGALLLYEDWFMATCSECHPQKIHFTQNEWAREKGYLKTGAEIDKKLKELNSLF